MWRKAIMGLAAAAMVAAVTTGDASARGWHGGGWHGGWHGGGWHGGGWGRGPAVGIGLGLGLAGAAAYGYPYYGGYYGYPYGYYASYGYYGGGCIRVQRFWTPYGWRIRRVNVCY